MPNLANHSGGNVKRVFDTVIPNKKKIIRITKGLFIETLRTL
jgi:hypothetical protein